MSRVYIMNGMTIIMASLFCILLNPSKQRFVTSFSTRSSVPRTVSSLIAQRSQHALYSSSSSSVNKDDETTTTIAAATPDDTDETPLLLLSDDIPLYQSQGLFCVDKPMDWTSSDVVSYIRAMLERDTRTRGGTVTPMRRRRKGKARKLKVGHGGTLDPLATGVLVIGVGRGTKELEAYLKGSKQYMAQGEFGFETTTLDLDPTASVAKNATFDHITKESLEGILPLFRGTIFQKPPMFSAIKKGGKKLYQSAREGKTEEDVVIEPREVTIDLLEVTDCSQLPKFDIIMECGGGTYVRSLIRDMAYALDSVATTTVLRRTKQGPFTLEDAIPKDDWSPETIYAAIDKFNASVQKEEEDCDEKMTTTEQ